MMSTDDMSRHSQLRIAVEYRQCWKSRLKQTRLFVYYLKLLLANACVGVGFSSLTLQHVVDFRRFRCCGLRSWENNNVSHSFNPSLRHAKVDPHVSVLHNTMPHSSEIKSIDFITTKLSAADSAPLAKQIAITDLHNMIPECLLYKAWVTFGARSLHAGCCKCC
jgi:hypothetical protein